MEKKEKKEKKTRKNPTPYLGIPRANKQVFTEQENRILDQFTIEIQEAWIKDLNMMKDCYNGILATCTELKSDIIKLQIEIGQTRYSMEKYKEFVESNTVEQFLNEIRVLVLQISEKINFQYTFDLNREVSKLSQQIKEMNAKLDGAPKPKWWQFWKSA